MQLTLRPAIERGRNFAFPAAWAAVLATGVGFYKPLPSVDVTPYLSFVGVGSDLGVFRAATQALCDRYRD